MNIKEMLEAARKAQSLAAAAVAAEANEANVKALEDANAEVADLERMLSKAQSQTADMESSSTTTAPRSAGSLGERFVKAAPYAEFAKAHPHGAQTREHISLNPTRVGSLDEYMGGRKAITTDVARLATERYPLIDQVVRPELSLLDLISRGRTGSTAIDYLQVTSVTRNAAIVKENTGDAGTDQLKPISTLATALETAKVVGYADGYEVTNQLLSDAPALASFLDNEFRYSLSAVIQDKLLNGSGTNGEPRGLLNTTGVQQQSFTPGPNVRPLIEAVRKAKTKVKRAGGTSTAVLLNPEDDEAIDLLADENGRYFSNGPFGVGPSTLWGLPRVLDESIDPGTAIVGEFQQIALLDYEGLSVVAFNQHKDFAQRNLTYVRAELRAMQAIWRPARFVVIDAA